MKTQPNDNPILPPEPIAKQFSTPNLRVICKALSIMAGFEPHGRIEISPEESLASAEIYRAFFTELGNRNAKT